MADFYPDIMGEYIDTSMRYQTAGVQYAGHFEPATMPPGQVSELYLFLQNTLDVPLKVNVKVEVPKTKGFFSGGKPLFLVDKPVIQLRLTEGEAGVLTLPVTTTGLAQDGKHLLTLEFKVATEGKKKGKRVRPAKSRSKLGKGPIDNLVGLNLVSTLGATYTEEAVKKARFPLELAGPHQEMERAPRLKHNYQTIWTQEQLSLFDKAKHELTLRDEKLRKMLTTEALFVNLYGESVFRFADAGLPLRIGEAITLAKILTYTCQLFLSSPKRRLGLLVPIWERALDAGMDTSNALQVIRSAGYSHILKLAIAISFGLLAQAIGRQPWSLDERQVVTHHIAENIDIGQTTEEDFLYLPLLMAGTLVSSRIKLDGEDVRHTLALMKQAYQTRTDLFFEDDLAQADKIYKNIIETMTQAG